MSHTRCAVFLVRNLTPMAAAISGKIPAVFRNLNRGRRGVCRSKLVLSAVLIAGIMVPPAIAWEFSMTGTYTWEYDAYTQLGASGFFGSFDVDDSDNPAGYGGTLGSGASMNGWLGYEIGQISSGSDLALATMYMDLRPQIRLNRAVRVRGVYHIGSWETPELPTSEGRLVRPEYAEGMAPGVQRSFSPGYWYLLWLTAHTPWGIIGVGKRSFPLGTGLMWDAVDNADAAGVILFTNYGPLRMGVGFSPWLLGQWRYFTLSDKNGMRQVDVAAGIIYDAGSLTAGVGCRYWRTRVGPESATFQGVDDPVFPTGRYGVIPEDLAVTHGAIYFKFFDGRFFFNTETDWSYGISKRGRWLSSSPGILPGGRSLFAPWYVEHTRHMVELGAVHGPAKVTLLWAWIPGPDRRHGIIIDRRPDVRFVSSYSNVTLFKPYSLLLSYTYGSGNNSFTQDSHHGYMTDANSFGARIDYAVAANLNLFVSFFHAERVSHGYPWGFVRPEYSDAGGQGRFTGRVEFFERDDFDNPAPTIPDSDLGHEVDWGIDWRLLEGYLLRTQFGTWQPGKWFSYACVDRSNPGWKRPGPANRWGINPSRTIDPVWGMEVRLEAEF